MPGAVLSDLCPLFYSMTTLYEVYYYPHSIDEEGEALEIRVTQHVGGPVCTPVDICKSTSQS